MSKNKASTARRKARSAPPHGSVALAKATWSAAKEHGLLFEDVIGCCSILIKSVSENSGESLEYLMSEVQRRLPPNKDSATDSL